MEHRKLLRRFQLRLLLHALVYAGLLGLGIGACSVWGTSFVYHLLVRRPGAKVLLLALAGGFSLGFLIGLLWNYPTAKRTARHIDRIGLQERAGTMVAYAKQTDTLARLQRKDAAAHIQSTQTSQLKLRLKKKHWISCAICLLLAAVMLLIPYDIFAAKSNISPEEAAKAQAIAELITNLRQEVAQSRLPQEAKDQLEDIIDQLEADLYNTDDSLEQAILIDRAKQDMNTVMNMCMSRYAIGLTLQRFELPRALGVAIYDGNGDSVTTAMADLENTLSRDNAMVTKLRSNVTVALGDSGVPNSDYLYYALAQFAGGLQSVEAYNSDKYVMEEAGGYYDEPSPLPEVFAQALTDILAALEEQAILAAEIESIQLVMQEGAQTLTDGQQGMPGPDQDDETSQQGGTGEGSSGEGGSAGDGVLGGMSDGPSNSTDKTDMLEGIYDPISGNVTYGEVFAAYYAQYLAALEAGEIPEELQTLLDKYFSALS